ncbi:MAG: hypothetical protein AAF517_03050 [Planctomycetota bacterium]
MSRKRQRHAVIVLSIAAAVIGFGTASQSFAIREAWHLHRYRSGDEPTKLAAAEQLAEIGSLRALPELLKCSVPRYKFVFPMS